MRSNEHGDDFKLHSVSPVGGSLPAPPSSRLLLCGSLGKISGSDSGETILGHQPSVYPSVTTGVVDWLRDRVEWRFYSAILADCTDHLGDGDPGEFRAIALQFDLAI